MKFQDEEIEVGDTISFKCLIAHRPSYGTRAVKGFDGHGRPQVAFNGFPDFVVKQHEVTKLVKAPRKDVRDLIAAAPTIYKLRYIVQESKRGGGFADVKRVDEKVVYGNLDRAREIYQEYLNDAQGFEQYRKYSVILELFTPHIHENGELAYWPDNENYIERHRTQGR